MATVGEVARAWVTTTTDALRASNLESAERVEGIQPGERIKLKANVVDEVMASSGAWVRSPGYTGTNPNYETVRREITAPDEPGTYTRTIEGETVTFDVVEATPDRQKDIDTNPDEEIDVSSAPGMQGAETVEEGVSDLAEETPDDAMTVAGVEMTPEGPRETGGLSGLSGGVLALLIALVLGAVAYLGGDN